MTINDLKKETPNKLRPEQIEYLREVMTEGEVQEISAIYENVERERG